MTLETWNRYVAILRKEAKDNIFIRARITFTHDASDVDRIESTYLPIRLRFNGAEPVCYNIYDRTIIATGLEAIIEFERKHYLDDLHMQLGLELLL